MKLYPNNPTFVWAVSISAITLSFLAISVIPLFLYDGVRFSPTLLITWLTASAIILTLAVSFESLRELKGSREHQFAPILNISKLDYNNDFSNQESNVHSTHITFYIRNSGEGKAINVKNYIYLRDSDDIQWVKKELDSSNFDLKADENVEQKTTFGNLTHPKGDNPNIVIELTFNDTLGKKYDIIKTYNYSLFGGIEETNTVDSLKLEDEKKVQTVEKRAKEKAKKMSRKFKKDISVEEVGCENQRVYLVITYNGNKLIDGDSLMFSTDTIVENIFTGIEIKLGNI
ncbi:hypothetical protein [Fodinibius sediminis]|uniref:Uncharacterized protein n=1 Tax=Fodinibius sediminis TaxID=1214077 RepID=A0A521F8K5_9BACT|nr:hypothetical protein [Fodinibius sediminis]SMO92539.1 hypothetical protein SAMN06265218_12617 [Fodinibius sediminis]